MIIKQLSINSFGIYCCEEHGKPIATCGDMETAQELVNAMELYEMVFHAFDAGATHVIIPRPNDIHKDKFEVEQPKYDA